GRSCSPSAPGRAARDRGRAGFPQAGAGVPGVAGIADPSTGFFFSSRRRHTRSVSAFLLNRSSDLSVRLKPLNCSRLPCVYAQETLTFLLTQKKTCVKNYVQKE